MSQRPEPLLHRNNKAVQRAGLAHHWRDLGGGLSEHPNLILAKDPGLDRLDNENAKQNGSIDEWNTEKRLVGIFTRFTKVLEPRVILHLLHGDREHVFGDKARETFVQSEAKSANTLTPKSHCCGQHEVGSIGFQQIHRTHIGLKTFRDQSDHIHESRGRSAAFRQISDFFQRQYVSVFTRLRDWSHFASLF